LDQTERQPVALWHVAASCSYHSGGTHMSISLITGAAGLIGSEAVRYFAAKGMHVVGIDNDMRKYFFGLEA